MDGFIRVVPELIKSSGDDHYLHVDVPENDVMNFLLITQQGCPACTRMASLLKEMQQDTDIYFPAIVYYFDTTPRGPDDVNHAIKMIDLDIMNVPMLYLINKKKRLIPFPLFKADGTRVAHLVDLSKEDILKIWSN